MCHLWESIMSDLWWDSSCFLLLWETVRLLTEQKPKFSLVQICRNLTVIHLQLCWLVKKQIVLVVIWGSSFYLSLYTCFIWRFKIPSIAGKEVLIKSAIQAHPFLCVSSNSLWGYLRNSLKWQLLSGGGRSIQNWRCIGLNGTTYVFLNAMVDWVSGSSNPLILLCWLSKGGNFWMIQTQS